MASEMQDRDGSRSPAIGSAAAVDLDLAFAAAEDLSPELLEAGGAWLDPLQGVEGWHGLLSSWLAELAPELPSELRSAAYSLGLSLVDDAEIAALNGDWRGQPGPTDVLAFAAQDQGLEDAGPMPLPSGPAATPGIEAEPGSGSDRARDAAHDAVNENGTEDAQESDTGDETAADSWSSPAEGWNVEASEGGEGEPLELGDIVISVPTASRQAAEHGHSLARELLFLASHGLLHLLGWDHPDAHSLAAMLARQEALLAAVPSRPG